MMSTSIHIESTIPIILCSCSLKVVLLDPDLNTALETAAFGNSDITETARSLNAQECLFDLRSRVVLDAETDLWRRNSPPHRRNEKTA